MNAPRIGLALGSGAARGWAHIGVLKTLADAGVEVSVVCGSSIGAVVGAAFAAGKLAQLETWARSLTWRNILGQLDLRPSGGGLIAGVRAIKTLADLIGHADIETLPIRYGAVATELGSGREVWLRDGDLAGAIRASIALPGVLSPLHLNGQWLVDGGLVNPVPLSLCRALGADVVLAVNLNGGIAGRHRRLPPPAQAGDGGANNGGGARFWRGGAGTLLAPLLRQDRQQPGYFDVLLGAVNIMQSQITRARLAGDPPDLLLQPRLQHIAVREFNRAAEVPSPPARRPRKRYFRPCRACLAICDALTWRSRQPTRLSTQAWAASKSSSSSST